MQFKWGASVNWNLPQNAGKNLGVFGPLGFDANGLKCWKMCRVLNVSTQNTSLNIFSGKLFLLSIGYFTAHLHGVHFLTPTLSYSKRNLFKNQPYAQHVVSHCCPVCWTSINNVTAAVTNPVVYLRGLRDRRSARQSISRTTVGQLATFFFKRTVLLCHIPLHCEQS